MSPESWESWNLSRQNPARLALPSQAHRVSHVSWQQALQHSNMLNGEELHLLLLFHWHHKTRWKSWVYLYIFMTFPTPLLWRLQHFSPPQLRSDRHYRNASAQEGRVEVAMTTLPPNFLASMHVTYWLYHLIARYVSGWHTLGGSSGMAVS